MRSAANLLTRSRYFNPALNAAIFDGPVRIYFAQYQESLALKVYFRFQDRLQNLLEADGEMRLKRPHVFVMLYPTEDIFSQSFPNTQLKMKIQVGLLGQDHVIGVCGALENEEMEEVFSLILGFLQPTDGLDHTSERHLDSELRELDF